MRKTFDSNFLNILTWEINCSINYFIAVHPLVKVPDQIVATSVGSNVSMSCVVESSPKSVNMWMRRSKDGARTSQNTHDQ